MPVPVTDIDQEILYILDFWIQNNNQLITGTIGQNVVWNLAQFIKKLPENYKKATIVATNSNYTTNSEQCLIIFTNNSSGGLNWVDNRWNKYYFVNGTNNVRTFFNGKFYYDLNGITQTTLLPRTELYIAKGEDDFWYQINAGAGGSIVTLPPIKGKAGNGGPKDPVVGSSLFQNSSLIGLGSTNVIDGVNAIDLAINKIPLNNYELTPDFSYDPLTGLIDFSPYQFQTGDTINIPLNQ